MVGHPLRRATFPKECVDNSKWYESNLSFVLSFFPLNINLFKRNTWLFWMHYFVFIQQACPDGYFFDRKNLTCINYCKSFISDNCNFLTIELISNTITRYNQFQPDVDRRVCRWLNDSFFFNLHLITFQLSWLHHVSFILPCFADTI